MSRIIESIIPMASDEESVKSSLEFDAIGAPYRKRISELEEELSLARNQIEALLSYSSSKKQSGMNRYWTEDEHSRYLEALAMFGPKDVKSISNHVGTRNTVQVRTHSQKYFLRLEREKQETENTEDQGLELFQKFINAKNATNSMVEFSDRIEKMQEKYLPEMSLKTIQSWMFAHQKTIETLKTKKSGGRCSVPVMINHRIQFPAPKQLNTKRLSGQMWWHNNQYSQSAPNYSTNHLHPKMEASPVPQDFKFKSKVRNQPMVFRMNGQWSSPTIGRRDVPAPPHVPAPLPPDYFFNF